ncbi:hypothetical protein BD769DRAFT_1381251 [Suillus cothurnatus]|nr:hypothetical protein BD769DRAFT_1381251 [Suillus cothurnatus]
MDFAELEGKLETLESGRAAKERQTNYYLAQGRGIRRVVALFDSIEDLVTENDRRYDDNEDAATIDQERLQIGYDILMRTLPWLLKTSSDMEHDDYMRMLKMLRQGADGARGDDTSKRTGQLEKLIELNLLGMGKLFVLSIFGLRQVRRLQEAACWRSSNRAR